MKYLKTQLKDLKLVCIKDSPPYITIGKTYQLIEYENSLGDLEYYYVGDNNEEINFYYQHGIATKILTFHKVFCMSYSKR